jgi:decaprenyl-diphosphate synthase subunit 2
VNLNIKKMALRKLCLPKSAFLTSYLQPSRKISVASGRYEKIVASKSEVRPSWDRSIEEAIKCVGYQTPYLSLRYLTNDEDVRWMENMEKLEGSNHPMCDTVKVLFKQGKANASQMWGLVVLLVSKLAGYPSNVPWQESEFDKDTGILKSQRILAESVEITSSAHEIHRDGVLNMQHYQLNGMSLDSDNVLIFGNKLAILGADILLGYASTQFSKLKQYQANILLTTAGRDIGDSNFIGDRDIQNNPLPTSPFEKLEEQKRNPSLFEEIPTDQIDNTLPFKLHDVMGSAEREWQLRHTLGGGTLLGKSCQAALILAKHSEEKQKEVYFMGKHMYLAYRAAKDLSIFRSTELPSSGKFSLVSAPILYHIEEDPSLYDEIKKGMESIENVDFSKVHKIVRNGPGLHKTKELLNKNNLIAFTLLHKFPKSESQRAIENLILSLEQ